jgi:peptidoglycan/xylan/chitin deacetylase (PgdA/CDA1 family)
VSPAPPAYLTIDDAPSAQLPAKLDLLAAREIPAVLFCEGRRLARYPDHAVAAIERGVHLGNHTYDHPHCSRLSPAAFTRTVDRTERLIEAAYQRAGVDRPAKLFRFPYGDRGDDASEPFQRLLAERGFQPASGGGVRYGWYRDRHADARDWFWTVDTRDYAVETPRELRAELSSDRVRDRLASPSADVILCHDAGTAVATFESLLDWLADREVTVGDPLRLVE